MKISPTLFGSEVQGPWSNVRRVLQRLQQICPPEEGNRTNFPNALAFILKTKTMDKI